MYYVSREEAQAFIAKLNRREPRERYRLPTEAEREYACRAGRASAYGFGDDEQVVGEYAWYDGNSAKETHPVGRKLPNAWGLYDMHGNVWEWVQDWYDDGFYNTSSSTDPMNEKTGSCRVYRGGSWSATSQGLMSTYRSRNLPGYRRSNVGFRLLRMHP